MKEKKKQRSEALRKYGIYSSIVFQMLFIIGISFWGGHKLDLYYGNTSNVLTVVIGLVGLCLSLYTTLKRLETINNEENNEK